MLKPGQSQAKRNELISYWSLSHQHIPNGLGKWCIIWIVLCFLMGLEIIYSFTVPNSQFFNPLASTVSQKKFGILTLLSMGHCFFQTSRSHASSKFKPFFRHLVRRYVLYTKRLLPNQESLQYIQPYIPVPLIKHPWNLLKHKVFPQSLPVFAAKFL